jgi:hypothetical protein
MRYYQRDVECIIAQTPHLVLAKERSALNFLDSIATLGEECRILKCRLRNLNFCINANERCLFLTRTCFTS